MAFEDICNSGSSACGLPTTRIREYSTTSAIKAKTDEEKKHPGNEGKRSNINHTAGTALRLKRAVKQLAYNYFPM